MPARAQTVTINPTDSQGSTLFAGSAPAVNTNATISIAVGANQHAYINYLQVGVCTDNTANIVVGSQLAFTSTNLGGWTQGLTANYQSTAVGTTGNYPACIFAGGPRTHPLVSAAGPVTVTIVPPAAQAHSSYPINVEYYLAP